jgi:hypothetical protein
VAGATGSVAECTGEEGLSHADRAEEDDILAAFDEAEAEELLDAVSVEGDGGIPVEVLEGLVLLEAGSGESRRSTSSWRTSSRKSSSGSVAFFA